jgi:surfeit locus 1 family protein
MIKRLPLIPTIFVLAAVAVMIGLGIWQIGRAREKAALLDQYRAAAGMPATSFPSGPIANEDLPLFRRATGFCLKPTGKRETAGRNRAGETGYVHIVECMTGAEGPGMAVEVGWSKDPNAKVDWKGGEVHGLIVPDSKTRMRLVAQTTAPGLPASVPPSVEDVPNNHISYAVQWFLFAIAALVIYGLAVAKRLKPEPPAK